MTKPQAVARPEPQAGAAAFDDLLTAWKAEARPTQRTVLEFTRAMNRLAEHVGHDDGARLTRDDIAGFREPCWSGWRRSRPRAR